MLVRPAMKRLFRPKAKNGLIIFNILLHVVMLLVLVLVF